MRRFQPVWVLAVLGACSPEPIPAAAAKQEKPASLAPAEARRPVMFDTPEADALLSSLQIFPKDNPWNEDIFEQPVHPNSAKVVAAVGADKRFRYNQDMAFILVPPDQPKVPVKLQYTDESDPGPYPMPPDAPIEGWPLSYEGKTLDQVQREGEGDRHSIVVDPSAMLLYEFFSVYRTPEGWKASCAAIFDLKSNTLRPRDWTSADAAGLPIFPAIVRYDECERGKVEHALRFTVRRTQKAYIYPATHQAGHGKDPTWPRMGDRFRLRKDFDVTPYPPHVRAILKALKKYGMFVADNGIEWAISVAPDRRIRGLETLNERPLRGRDFEMIVTTGANEGPRAVGR